MKPINWVVLIILIALFAFALWFTSCATITTPEDRIKQNAMTIEVSFRAVTRESLSIVKLNYPDKVADVTRYWQTVGIQLENASIQPYLDAIQATTIIGILLETINDEVDFLPPMQARLVADLLNDTGEIMAGYLKTIQTPPEIQLYLISASKGIANGIRQFEEIE